MFVLYNTINTQKKEKSMSDNLYEQAQPVQIRDPSGRLGASGLATLNFPYTPTITVITSTGYSSYDLSHTNFQQRAFDMASNTEFNMTAPIMVRSEAEGQSVLKMAQFLRGALKMDFGRNSTNPGLPPPILRLDAHGIYTNVPVLVRDFTWNLDQDVDYLTIGNSRVPVQQVFVLSLTTSYSPKNVRENFTYNDFLSGKLSSKGYI